MHEPRRCNPVNGETVFERTHYRVRLGQRGEPWFWLDLATFTQPLRLAASVDTLTAFDRDLSLFDYIIEQHGLFERIMWRCQSALWDKTYYLDLYASHVEFYAAVSGTGQVDAIRYFEAITDVEFVEHFALTKHFNDRGHTSAREYSRASPAAFDVVFCPEPNSYARQQFHAHEYAQISVNADLDYCGGNFIANPGILAFAVSAAPEREWLAMGLAVRPGEYLFSEFEYLGGHEFGLRVNSWGARSIAGRMETPRVVLVCGNTAERALEAYIDRITERGWVRRAQKQRIGWWERPIVCGWGHQCYQADLFRVRSPEERGPDNAAYTLSTQANYRDIVDRLDEHQVPWGTLVIDARWFLAGGLKDLDVGRWPDLRGFIDQLHQRDKRVLLWWSIWDTDGLPADECIRYEPAGQPTRQNRSGRLSKFGVPQLGKKLAIDVTLPQVRDRIRQQVRTALGNSSDCLNADGFKIDQVAGAPGLYGMAFPLGSTKLFGIEAAKEIHRLLYECAKDVKYDSLVIGQSPNPYFSEILDMVRLGDIYTHNQHSVIDEMEFRARMVRIADPTWLIDTDGWPMPSLSALREYVSRQPELGVPSLYYVTHLDTTGESIDTEVFATIRSAWATPLTASKGRRTPRSV